MNESERPELTPVDTLVHFVLTKEVLDLDVMTKALALRRGPLRQLLASAIESPALQEGIKDPEILREFQHLSRTLTQRDTYGSADYVMQDNTLDELLRKYGIAKSENT